MEHLNPNQFKLVGPRYRVIETDGGHSIYDGVNKKDVGTLGVKTSARKPRGIPDLNPENTKAYRTFHGQLFSKVSEMNKKYDAEIAATKNSKKAPK